MAKKDDSELDAWRYRYPSGAVSWDLTGDPVSCQQFVGEAKNMLYRLKNRMNMAVPKLKSLQDIRHYDGGTVITVRSIFGQDFIEITTPPSIQLVKGEVFVTDSGNSRVQVFDLNGVFKRKWGEYGTENGQFDNPLGIHVYKNKSLKAFEVFVVDCLNHRIQVFKPNGKFIRTWGEYGTENGQLDCPAGIWIKDDEVFVTENENMRVQVFDLYGNFKRKWGEYGDGDGELAWPGEVYVYKDEDVEEVFVADSGNRRVQVFDLYGNFKRKWDTSQITEPCGVYGIFIYNDEVFVSLPYYYGGGKIKVFDRYGTFIRTLGEWGTENGQFEWLYGIWVEKDKVFAVDGLNCRIQVLGLDGKFKRKWGKEGTKNRQFNIPIGIFVSSTMG